MRKFSHFLPHFGSPVGRLAHQGRPWLHHWPRWYYILCCQDVQQVHVAMFIKSLYLNIKKHFFLLFILNVVLPVRLVDGVTSREGRVEIFHNNEWKTVCGKHFGAAEADVICRQLGFKSGDHRALQNAYFTPGVGSIYVIEHCDGKEQALNLCQRGADISCSHDDDASVICDHTTIYGRWLLKEQSSNHSMFSFFCVWGVWGCVFVCVMSGWGVCVGVLGNWFYNGIKTTFFNTQYYSILNTLTLVRSKYFLYQVHPSRVATHYIFVTVRICYQCIAVDLLFQLIPK